LAGVERTDGSRRVAVDAVFDSVPVATTFQEELAKTGVLFMPPYGRPAPRTHRRLRNADQEQQ
jgi:hypothetical protein